MSTQKMDNAMKMINQQKELVTACSKKRGYRIT